MRPTSSKAAGAARFPAFSITGGACALDCDHCQAKILEPMIPATRPEVLEREVRTRAAAGGLAGFLLSGGSNRRNEVPFERFLPTIARLKADLPHLRIAAHTGLVDRWRAERLAEAGVEVAMLDVIGAEATIREVYHLDRPVADFEAALEALVATPLRVVPHVVIGLHYGRVLGEFRALEIIARHRVDACILVVVMPAFTRPGRFRAVDPIEVADVFLAARELLPQQSRSARLRASARRAASPDRRLCAPGRARRHRVPGRRHRRSGAGARPPGCPGPCLLRGRFRPVLSDPDVLVVGLGPAGACAAAAAARAGARVLAFERRRRIGWPVQCAELVPRALASDAARRAAVQELYGLETVVENDEVEVRADRGRIIDRARFDALLADDARAVGATLRTGIAVAEVAADGHVRLSDGTSLHPRAIVGADGPRSLVGRAIGSTQPGSGAGASDPHPAARPAASWRACSLPHATRAATAGCFRGAGMANLGCGVAVGAHQALGALLADLAVALARAGIVEPEPLGRTGGVIPVGGIVGPAGRLGDVPGAARGRRRRPRPSGDRRRHRGGGPVGNPGRRGCGGGESPAIAGALPAYAEELRDLFAGAFERALARRRATWRDPPSPAALRRGWPGFRRLLARRWPACLSCAAAARRT